MAFTIDMDTGGTFTDGFFTRDGDIRAIKVDTTPHDLTVCVQNRIKKGADSYGISEWGLLRDIVVVRLSTTIGTNTLITSSSPKIGLIVTKGFEHSLYISNKKPNPLFKTLLSANRIIGIKEEMDSSGQSIKAPAQEAVRYTVKQLLEKGVKMTVSCLRNAGCNNSHERRGKDIIAEDFPSHYTIWALFQHSFQPMCPASGMIGYGQTMQP